MPRPQPAPVSLDDTDRRLLRALYDDPDLTNKALAHRLGLAESTCAYRLRSLRERGVIIGRRLRLDLATLGFPLEAVIKVRLNSHSQGLVRSFHDEVVKVPGVIQIFHVGGDDDYLLHVAVEDAQALRDLVLDHITVHKVVRQTGTQLVFERRDGAGVL